MRICRFKATTVASLANTANGYERIGARRNECSDYWLTHYLDTLGLIIQYLTIDHGVKKHG